MASTNSLQNVQLTSLRVMAHRYSRYTFPQARLIEPM